MRLKKRQIQEMVANQTSQPQNANLPSKDELDSATNAIKDFTNAVSDLPFISNVDENDDPTFNSDYIDYLADKDTQNQADYDEWLQSLEGMEFMNKKYSNTSNDTDLIPESTKNNRKVIKTIKVKDIK